ncbi:hypothetical protein ACLBPU_30570, partial [Klebsiella pneumoniae]
DNLLSRRQTLRGGNGFFCHREAVLQAEGIDAQRLHDEVQESPQGAAILTRFVSAFLTPDVPGH